MKRRGNFKANADAGHKPRTNTPTVQRIAVSVRRLAPMAAVLARDVTRAFALAVIELIQAWCHAPILSTTDWHVTDWRIDGSDYGACYGTYMGHDNRLRYGSEYPAVTPLEALRIAAARIGARTAVAP